jgi:hypothetical protein
MSAAEILRLAWHVDHEGREVLRDALLTLAVAESGPDEAVSAERCRRLLIARRPDHWLAQFPTLGQALSHPRVAEAVDRLRKSFPMVRVRWMLLRAEASRGPYTGRSRPIAQVVDDLLGRSAEVRDMLGDGLMPPSEGGTPHPRAEEPAALPFPRPSEPPDRPDPLADLHLFYWTILMAMAILVASVLSPAAQDHKAA